MKVYVDLEIELRQDKEDKELYQIDVQFSDPGFDTSTGLPDGPVSFRFDSEVRDALRERELRKDVDGYGRLLSGMLFEGGGIREVFSRARTITEARDSRLRIRLRIRGNDDSLHDLRWETIRDPQDEKETLTTNESMLFSRFVDSKDYSNTELRPSQEQRALIAVANPQDLGEFDLAEIDVEGEVARAKDGLGEKIGEKIPTTVLAANGEASKKKIFAELRKGYDILYLVAHGRINKIKGKEIATLYLDDGDGNTDFVDAEDFVGGFSTMRERPRLVVLASCESAGKSGTLQDVAAPMAAIGPRLAHEGIPAVLAMQGTISMDTVEQFMPVFFKALIKENEIDTAMAIARSRIRDRHDWWMPVLYMRLKSGRMNWYPAGFAEEFEDWDVLVDGLEKTTVVPVTPILGSGLGESLFGTRHDLAHSWAEKYEFPLRLSQRDDLPQVAQFLEFRKKRRFVVAKLVTYLVETIRDRHWARLSDKRRKENIGSMLVDEQLEALNRLLLEVWEGHQELNEYDPYRAMASIDFPFYITTAQSDILYSALKMEDKEPIRVYAPWKNEIELISKEDLEKHESCKTKHPLIYHMFGHFKEFNSLVITEDDYFDYLIGITRNKDLIPKSIRRALTSQTLLILGLNFNTWESRILFRWLRKQGGAFMLDENQHVSAQIAPTPSDVKEPEQARKYLEGYFDKGSIKIFWGKPEGFIKLMKSKLTGGSS